MRLPSVLRLLAGGLIVVGGALHYDLWSGGYRGIPSVGPLFLVNVAASALVAAALVVSGRAPVLVAGALLSVASLAALVASRTVGLLGFVEGWTDASLEVLAAEVGAVVALAACAVARRATVVEARATIPVQGGSTDDVQGRTGTGPDGVRSRSPMPVTTAATWPGLE